MTILAAKVKIPDLGIEFRLGDQQLTSLVVSLGAQSRSSSASFTIIDPDFTISEKVFKWSRENGGIKIPAELRQTAATVSTTGTTGSTGSNPGGTTDGAKLEGLEGEIVEVSAYMDVISWCEGTYPDGYNIMFGGATFSDFSDHPRSVQGGGGLSSDAAGRYQFLSTTWDSVSASVGVTDFSPKSQNICGWQLAKNRGVTPDDIVADVISALKEANQEWASLPGSPYGQPTKTEGQCQEQYDKVLAERKAKEGTATAATTTTESGDTGVDPAGFNYYPNDFTATLRAYLDVIAYCLGTFELGDEGYFNDPQNETPLTDLDTYPGYTSGRYNINQNAYDLYYNSIEAVEQGYQPSRLFRFVSGLFSHDSGVTEPVPDPEPTEGVRDFVENTQDIIARFILQTPSLTGEGTFENLSKGDIVKTNETAKNYWQQLPGGELERYTNEQVQEFFDDRVEYWTGTIGAIEEDNTGSGLPASAGGTDVEIHLQTAKNRYRYKFTLTGTMLDSITVPTFTFECQAAKYGLAIDPVNQNYENITALELIETIAYRHNLPVKYAPNVEAREPIERIEQDDITDEELIDGVAEDEDLAVTDDPTTGGLKVTDKKSRIRKAIIIDQIISIAFEDRGVVDEEPLYPVMIDSVTNDSLLSLEPEETINLNNLYTFVPESIKRDDWVVSLISHDITNHQSRLELLKYIPIEVVAGGIVAGGGGTLTADQVMAKYKNSSPNVSGASGYVISADGYIGTAAHVVEHGTTVTFPDGQSYEGTLVFSNTMPNNDVAVIKIEATGLVPIPFAPDAQPQTDGSDKILYKIGYPGGSKEPKVGSGTVREVTSQGKDGIQGKEVIIAEDTPDFVNGGDSGCPWFDHWGLLIASTTGGSNDSQTQGPGDYGYGPSINEIKAACDANNVPYTTGTRASATPSDGGVGAGGGGGGAGAVEGWVLPSKGVVTSEFGPRTSPTAGASSNHKGIDIAAGSGADIYAAASGTVAVRNDNTDGSGYGNYLVISHPDHGVSTLYGHCQELLVSVGEAVSAGQLIARENNTGTSTGSHLHFGVNKDVTGKNIFSNTFVNPRDYLGNNFNYSYGYLTFGVENFQNVCIGDL